MSRKLSAPDEIAHNGSWSLEIGALHMFYLPATMHFTLGLAHHDLLFQRITLIE